MGWIKHFTVVCILWCIQFRCCTWWTNFCFWNIFYGCFGPVILLLHSKKTKQMEYPKSALVIIWIQANGFIWISYVGVAIARFLNASRSLNSAGSILVLFGELFNSHKQSIIRRIIVRNTVELKADGLENTTLFSYNNSHMAICHQTVVRCIEFVNVLNEQLSKCMDAFNDTKKKCLRSNEIRFLLWKPTQISCS